MRHFESVKNTQTSFSSLDDFEELTEKGKDSGTGISRDILKIIKLNKWKVKNIYCAASVRAKKSAEIIAKAISNDINIISFKELLSTKSSDIVGRTKDEVRKSNPQFIKELALYDAGIYNSYNFHREVNKTLKQEYEKQVSDCLNSIINNEENETMKIVVLHNSSITAGAIYFARKYYDYPKDFYGKVAADNGSVFWIHIDNNGSGFRAANCTATDLLKFMEEGLYESG